ncbi:MAG TPA: DUF2934 domain-containing protein [Mariprofundaceae bacterium]|nr:DUF2934 domain-containing protein [Mariprofundaceae bacterium]
MPEAKKTTRKPARKASLKGAEVMSMLQERRNMVAEAAYYRAQQRDFAAGNEMEDWLEAEKEVDRQLGNK